MYAFDSKKERFACLPTYNTLSIVQLTTGTPMSTIAIPNKEAKISCFAWSHSNKEVDTIAIGTDLGIIFIYDLKTNSLIFKLGEKNAESKGRIQSLFFDQKNDLYSLTESGFIAGWNLKTGILTWNLEVQTKKVNKIVVSPDSRYLAVADSQIRLYEISSKKKVSTIQAQTYFSDVRFTPGCNLIVCSELTRITVWDFLAPNVQSGPNQLAILNANDNISHWALNDDSFVGNLRDKHKSNRSVSFEIIGYTKTRFLVLWSVTLPTNSTVFEPIAKSSPIDTLLVDFCTWDEVALVTGNIRSPFFEKIKYRNSEKVFTNISAKQHPQEERDNRKVAGKAAIEAIKQTIRTTSSGVQVVGGQTKIKESQDFATLSEKLAKLESVSQTLDSKKSIIPKARSIQSVLEEALRTKDETLIVSCLATSDVNVIDTTIELLDRNYILPLLNQILNGLSKKSFK